MAVGLTLKFCGGVTQHGPCDDGRIVLESGLYIHVGVDTILAILRYRKYVSHVKAAQLPREIVVLTCY
jgi:hypothetical protein